MIATVLLYCLSCIFLLKIGWNLLIPYVLGKRLYRNDDEYTDGISMAPFVEVFILLVAVIVSFLSSYSEWIHSPTNLLIWGGGLIIFSYFHLLVVGAILGWAIQRNKSKTEKTGEKTGSETEVSPQKSDQKQ